jgi:hypothetical protein
MAAIRFKRIIHFTPHHQAVKLLLWKDLERQPQKLSTLSGESCPCEIRQVDPKKVKEISIRLLPILKVSHYPDRQASCGHPLRAWYF